ncbi:unnamed protein product [Chilo suppressalis]|uniref:Uncharacterized protein n=1 Tax=Chilo suppressalis TaxID=168631 RepID=A0ABN8EDL1_CHISP|nr:hypothetical protein evm_000281 [Chilo suppressalis]CAH0675588.1 unnamed protein product [Chilo suppressalis]
MFSPEEQQIEICLLKSNLEKIGDDLLNQNSALPALDAENDQKYRETMTALRIARSLNAERERLNLENVRLTAKRMQLKRQCEDITKELDCARENRNQLTDLLKRDERNVELLIRNYEDTLRGKADRFRETSSFYDEDIMRLEIEKVNNTMNELEIEMGKREKVVGDLKFQLDHLESDIPEDLMNIVGKAELEEKVKEITEKYKTLCNSKDRLLQK